MSANELLHTSAKMAVDAMAHMRRNAPPPTIHWCIEIPRLASPTTPSLGKL